MPLPKPLPELQSELCQLLTEDLKATLLQLQSLLPTGTPLHDELYLLLGRYNALRALDRSEVAEGDEIRRIENQIRKDLLEIIDGLTEADFLPAESSAKAGRQGVLLYQVPQMMALGEETRCLVRIALNETVLREDLKIIDHTEERALKKISKSMQVELGDPSGGKNFSIRTTSKSVQTIDLEGDEYTEWRFYATPLREGEYLLEVKVSVIELVDGERELREKVLEESVRIISGDQAAGGLPSAPETAFKPAGEALAFSQGLPAENLRKENPPEAAPMASAPMAPPPPPFATMPSPPPSTPADVTDPMQPYIDSRAIESATPVPDMPAEAADEPAYSPAPAKGLRSVAFFLAFLVLGSATTWAVTPAATLDWWIARVKDSPEAYADYIAGHAEAPQAETAWYRKALKSKSVHDIRQYLSRYRQGRYGAQMTQALQTAEQQYWNEASAGLDPEKVRRFLAEFPESERLPALKKAIDAYPEKAAALLPALEKAYLESVRRTPSEAGVRQFLSDFPHSDQLPRVMETVQQQPALREKVQPLLDEALLNRAAATGNTEAVEQYLQTISDSTRLETFKRTLERTPAIRRQVVPELQKARERIRRN